MINRQNIKEKKNKVTSSSAMDRAPEMASPCRSLRPPLIAVRYPIVRFCDLFGGILVCEAELRMTFLSMAFLSKKACFEDPSVCEEDGE